MSVLVDLFGNWSGSRLAPRRFALLWVLLFVLLLTTLVLAAVIAVAGEGTVDPKGPAVRLAATFGVTGLMLFFVGMFNITVKRGRDTGVQGFVTGTIFFVTLMLGGVPLFFNILLALVPQDTFRRARA
jgi:uncharacterized membrane protein YhaH (DUF805 family)